ncbi:MAG: hypothetical protein QOD96_6622 [Pseudonocardiales bacterium]|nr:hypothetical protein [Pseudonocardiales bacterium]
MGHTASSTPPEHRGYNPVTAYGQSKTANNLVGSARFGVLPYSVDPESAARLWDLSVHLTGTSHTTAGHTTAGQH